MRIGTRGRFTPLVLAFAVAMALPLRRQEEEAQAPRPPLGEVSSYSSAWRWAST
jgi:hypothetical protein